MCGSNSRVYSGNLDLADCDRWARPDLSEALWQCHYLRLARRLRPHSVNTAIVNLKAVVY
jgi:hypothetical protein